MGLFSRKKSVIDEYTNINMMLYDIYKKKCRPIEEETLFDQIISSSLTEGDFTTAPTVLVMGHYSTGKTTFIQHMLNIDYPGSRTGVEPTTEKFVVIQCDSNNQTKITPGPTAVLDRRQPWSQLSRFGPQFLCRFEIIETTSDKVSRLTLIDTPGILGGVCNDARGYRQNEVIRWFIQRVDMVLLFFDAHKLDLSTEMCECVSAIVGYENKLRIIINKADQATREDLFKVQSTITWNLGKILPTSELPPIFVGSFWDKLNRQHELIDLFIRDEENLCAAINSLAELAVLRKGADLVKRVQQLRSHAELIDGIIRKTPWINRQKHIAHAFEQLESYKYELIKKKIFVHSGIPTAAYVENAQLLAKKCKNFKLAKILPTLIFIENRIADTIQLMNANGTLTRKSESCKLDTGRLSFDTTVASSINNASVTLPIQIKHEPKFTPNRPLNDFNPLIPDISNMNFAKTLECSDKEAKVVQI